MAPEDSGFHANPDSVFMNSNRPAWGRESDHQLSETPGIHRWSDWTGTLRLASSPTSLLPGIQLSFFVLSRKTGPSYMSESSKEVSLLRQTFADNQTHE